MELHSFKRNSIELKIDPIIFKLLPDTQLFSHMKSNTLFSSYHPFLPTVSIPSLHDSSYKVAKEDTKNRLPRTDMRSPTGYWPLDFESQPFQWDTATISHLLSIYPAYIASVWR